MYPLFLYRRTHENITGPGLRQGRRAMLAMLVLFGPFSYYMAMTNPLGEKWMPDLWPLRWVGYGLSLLAVIAVAMLRQMWPRAAESARPQLGRIGSVLAFLASLFGGLFMMLGGEAWIYAVGLLVFLGTSRLLPSDPQAA